ncbi:MAG: OsmC family peroxiredoxin [Saprospirales bacterium]|nr:MAG: OsmC family peroxiredoxin [Saprospirales bacterium]
MATSIVTYVGDLRTEAQHLRSGTRIISDAPVDNQGKGEAFSPTDLLSTSLASCMLTIMGIKARDLNLNIDGSEAEVEKIMASDPRRVAEIRISLKMNHQGIIAKEQKILERAGLNCPVLLSLHPDIVKEIDFKW